MTKFRIIELRQGIYRAEEFCVLRKTWRPVLPLSTDGFFPLDALEEMIEDLIASKESARKLPLVVKEWNK